MSDEIQRADEDEGWRRNAFPACRDRIFMAHAAVTAVPRVAVDAMTAFNEASATGELDYGDVFLRRMDGVRASAARLIGSDAEEIALLGPTSLGLSLVANGIDWREGDQVVTYLDDYPANVYPWKHLEARGVEVVYLQPREIGEITPELVEAAITPRTRLLALASNNFLSGYRIDVEAMGEIARRHDALFCLDAIQTAGAFPAPAGSVDFLSADAHKWLLGPVTAGIVYVDRSRFEELEPSLIGAWNVKSPNFIAQDAVEFEPTARRYEPGVLNAPGLLGMQASLDLLTGLGIDRVAARLLDLKSAICKGLDDLGFDVIGPRSGANASGITTFTDRDRPERIGPLFHHLGEHGVVASFRHDREGAPYIRLSPHFYNTPTEVEQVMRQLRDASA